MPLDPSIALQAGAGVPDAPNALDTIGKIATLSNSVAQNRLLGVATNQRQLDLSNARNQWIAQQAFSVYQQAKQDPAAAWHELENIYATGKAQGLLTDQDINAAHSYLQATTDPQHFADRVFRMGMAALGIPQQAEQQAGSVQLVNTGGEQVPTVFPGAMARAAGVGVPGPIESTMTPEGQVAVHDLRNENGSLTQATGADIARANGLGRLLPGGRSGAGGGAGGLPAIPANIMEGPIPPNSPAAAPQAPAQAVPAPRGTLGNSPPMGAPETLQANQAAFREAHNDVPAAVLRLQGLSKAQQALKLALTGKGSEGLQNVQSFMTTLGLAPDFIKANTANYDLARKYLLDYARNQTRGTTNDQLAAAIGSNASPEISNQAALDVVRTNIGRERMGIAATMAAPDENGTGFIKHRSTFFTNNDPVAFAADQYSPQELKAHEASLGKDAKERFYRSLALANRLKMINVGQ